jgi:hypothetical protein
LNLADEIKGFKKRRLPGNGSPHEYLIVRRRLVKQAGSLVADLEGRTSYEGQKKEPWRGTQREIVHGF